MTQKHKTAIRNGIRRSLKRRRQSKAMKESWARRRYDAEASKPNAVIDAANESRLYRDVLDELKVAPIKTKLKTRMSLDWLRQQALDSSTAELNAKFEQQPASVSEYYRGQCNAYMTVYQELSTTN